MCLMQVIFSCIDKEDLVIITDLKFIMASVILIEILLSPSKIIVVILLMNVRNSFCYSHKLSTFLFLRATSLIINQCHKSKLYFKILLLFVPLARFEITGHFFLCQNLFTFVLYGNITTCLLTCLFVFLFHLLVLFVLSKLLSISNSIVL